MKWQKWTAALAAFCMTVTMTGVPASAEQASLPAAGKDTGGMLIRRTYEAFFPLIVTAIIYFLIAWVLSLLLKGILHRIDPKRRKRKAGAV